MKQNKRTAFFFVLAALTIWFTCSHVQEGNVIRDNYTAQSVRLKLEGTTLGKLKDALEQEKNLNPNKVPDLTAWSVKENVPVQNQHLKRQKKVMAVMTAGRMEQTGPFRLVYGNYVYAGDRKGCVIDTSTAYSLFGTRNAIGNRISCENKEYSIRGVVVSSIPVILFQGTKETAVYYNLEFCYEETDQAEMLTREFMERYQLAENFTVVDGYFFGRLLSYLYVLPLWIFYLILVCLSFRALLNIRKQVKPLFFLGTAVAAAAIWMGFGLLLYQAAGSPFYWPEKLVPTRWSDFDYWSRQWQEIKTQYMDMRYAGASPKDIFLADRAVKSMLTFVLTSALYGLLLSFKQSVVSIFIGETAIDKMAKLGYNDVQKKKKYLRRR